MSTWLSDLLWGYVIEDIDLKTLKSIEVALIFIDAYQLSMSSILQMLYKQEHLACSSILPCLLFFQNNSGDRFCCDIDRSTTIVFILLWGYVIEDIDHVLKTLKSLMWGRTHFYRCLTAIDIIMFLFSYKRIALLWGLCHWRHSTSRHWSHWRSHSCAPMLNSYRWHTNSRAVQAHCHG